jgi:quercetin dioxygenase-like cupin family protein
MKAKMTWLVIAIVAIMPIVTRATPNNGVLFNIISRGTTGDEIETAAHTGRWHAVLHTNSPTDFVSQDVAFAPGGYSGWHSHPGPALVTVKAGTATFYQAHDPDCAPHAFPTGSAFVEPAGHVHTVQNEGSTDLELLVTYIIPAGAPQRIDQPHPDTCPAIP